MRAWVLSPHGQVLRRGAIRCHGGGSTESGQEHRAGCVAMPHTKHIEAGPHTLFPLSRRSFSEGGPDEASAEAGNDQTGNGAW
jgi:hypothetical protein